MRHTSRKYAVIAVCCLFASSLASPAQAGTQFGGQVNGAFNTHTMSDWNDIIDESNQSGSSFDNINNGFSFGAGPFVIINGQWVLGAHFERLMASTSEDGTTEVKNSANAFGANAAYLFPSQSPLAFGIGVALDFLSLSGELNDTSPPAQSFKTNGSGVGFQFKGIARYAFGPAVAGEVSAGYRVADINIDDIDGQDVSSSGLNSEDYSGAIVRVAITVHSPAN